MQQFSIVSNYKPAGDQPQAIYKLVTGLNNGNRSQVLLGITGSGKTFTMANIIERTQRPSLIMVHNKTLAAQIYAEMKELFPNNAVEYFVSYYDYYRPEAYIARTDTYIEKDSAINEQIDLFRHSATRSLTERRDVIVVASVSCIYGLGSPDLYYQMTIQLQVGSIYPRGKLLNDLVNLQYQRNDICFERGNFRVAGEIIDIFPTHYDDKAWRLSFFGNELEQIHEFDPLSGKKSINLNAIIIYANSHFVTSKDTINRAISNIQYELQDRLKFFYDEQKFIEAQRLESRTQYDMEMMIETGSCRGIENYSRFFTNSEAGNPPPTLFNYLPKDALLFIDESHVMVPQIRAMYEGDRSRKANLVEYGFRLPSAMDNRPLKFEEWQQYRPQTIFTSATPSIFELNEAAGEIVEQIIRPTGLLDPICIVKPVLNQVEDLLSEIKTTIETGFRILVTTLTKKMAEDLTTYLQELGIKVSYLHSEIHTLERVEIIKDLRQGTIDVLVGINLLREGLDIPECSLVAILDADKEGFLRSEVALIQTIGRAARNKEGRVVLYADRITKSIEGALSKTANRRKIQEEYNLKHNVIPINTNRVIDSFAMLKNIDKSLILDNEKKHILTDPIILKRHIERLKKEMRSAASNLEFELAVKIRDQIRLLETI